MRTGRHRTSRAWAWILLPLLCAGATVAAADEASSLPEWIKRTKLSGEVFADAYMMSQHHDEDIEGANGFWIRRITLSFDSKLSEAISARLRFEANGSGDFQTSDRTSPYVKDAWFKWKREAHFVQFGLIGTPTWETSEKGWGYRSVEKVGIDLQRLGSSRDLGVIFGGDHAESGIFYRVMLGNGSDRTDTNEGKKGYATLGFRPTKDWVIEVQADFEDRPGESDRRTYQGFFGFSNDRYRAGLNYATQRRENGSAGDLSLDLVSAHGVGKINDRVTLLGRIDRMLDPNPEGDRITYLPFATTAKSTLSVLGVDVTVLKDLNIIPNLEYIAYGDAEDGGPDPDDDLMVRVTCAWRF